MVREDRILPTMSQRPSQNRRFRRLSSDDQDVWHFVTRDVAPLRDKPSNEFEDRSVSRPLPLPKAPRHWTPPSEISKPANHLPELSHGSAPGLDRRTSAKLRRGKVVVEGRLDLHGMTRDQARGALHGFLHRGQTQGKKCVLVVTGRGLQRDGQIGVLRRAVPEWLNEMRALVHAFHYAAPQDGGEGALYVLLRRKRSG
ncbi:Smr/MutS family protein [Magnetospira sp. QH-2]|uniref:Smr/MutS family protein n=1 Tax=Magnetospira sp. (strain QH-2) TaxID=1288970 RepID=UPI0009E43FAF|nr:Smr/MutS family protein [Magnetospira sp. QH-2]